MRKLLLYILLFALTTMLHAQENCKVGICLSGGGALGYAHIGVLKALEEYGIKPDIVSGSSMGAVIGVMYAQGYSADTIFKIIQEERANKVRRIITPTFNDGISSHKKLREILNKYIPYDSFDSLRREFHVCVSNLSNATWKTINTGNLLHDYVIASASIPFVFEAITIDDTIYVDGGLFNNLPAQPLKGRSDMIIGVNVVPYTEVKEVNSANEVLSLSIRGVSYRNSLDGRSLCDFLIDIPPPGKYNSFSFDKYKEIYQAGYETAIQHIKDHPEILTCKNKNTQQAATPTIQYQQIK